MSQKATSVGDIAARVLSRRTEGEATRVFQRSAYIQAGNDFLLLLWGRLRSPITINIEASGRAQPIVRVGERCALSPDRVGSGSEAVDVTGADTFRSALLDRRRVAIPAGPALVKGVAMLRALYDASPSGPSLVNDPAVKSFVAKALVPLSEGKTRPIHSPFNYIPLIGRGGGFTPAGDDFIGGVLTAFNFVARCKKARQVRIPRPVLGRTIPESAAILGYSSRGHVDEEVGSFVLRTLEPGARFYDELLAVAHRGHTSGVDMSLGVLLCEAALAQREGEEGALEACLDGLWHR